MTILAVASIPILLLASWDVASCLRCYVETRRAAAQAPPAPGERPRSIAPDQITLRHALLFLAQKANYYWQILTALVLLARLHLRPRPTEDRDVALLILDTSLATWVSAKPIGEGAVLATLSIEGFAFPLFPDRYDATLVVEIEISGAGTPSFTARTRRFDLDGVPIRSRDEQLSILAIMTSSVTHPVIHSFNNRVYAAHADPRLSAIGDVFLHGQYLNWCAWFFPGVLFRIARRRGHRWYRRVLAHNALLPLPVHHRASLGLLAPYSRAIRFLLAARPVLARALQRHDLPLDREAFFICSILHAVDHVGCDRHTRGHLLRHDQLPDRGFYNLIALLFYRPAQHFWTNLLRDKQGRHPFYADLYEGLRAADPELADEVTLSIAY